MKETIIEFIFWELIIFGHLFLFAGLIGMYLFFRKIN
jgi:hypothetical protein